MRAALGNRAARYVIVVMALMIASGVTAMRVTVHNMNHPPMLQRNAYLEDDVVPAGGTLILIVTDVNMDEDVNCTGYIIREFSREIKLKNGKTVTLKKRALVAPPPAGTSGEYGIEIPLMPGMRPGRWHFVGETVRDCGVWLGGVSKYQTISLDFEVMSDEDFKALKTQ